MIRPTSKRAAVAAAVLVALAGAPLAAEPAGRATQPHEIVTTTITPADDKDDLLFEAGAGWKVSAAVKRAKTDSLAPVLELLDPDGDLLTSGVVSKATATSAKLTATLPEGGRWALRIRGSSGTGLCTLKWKLTPAKIVGLKNAAMAADVEQLIPVPARGGALLSWKLKFKGDGAVQVGAVLDPDGGDAGFDPASPQYVTRKLTSEAVKDFPLPANGPGGQWALRVETEFAPTVVSLSVKVTLPKLAAVSVTLSPNEPSLLSLSNVLGGCGAPVTITGTHLSANPQGIYFGTAAATQVSVTDDEHADCRVPAGTGTVDVTFVGEDGQIAVLEDAYTFEPKPVIDSFDPTNGPGTGNVELTIRGHGFQTGIPGLYYVLVGGTNASQVVVVDSETITCKTPANVAGPQTVVLRNTCGETVTAPGFFTYGAGLYITTVRPDSVPIFGGVSVLVSGTNFSVNDVVSLAGTPVPTTPVYFQTSVVGHRIEAADLPTHAPGRVDVRVQPPIGLPATKVNGLAYFAFSDGTAALIPAASATDDWGGVSNALADSDADGKIDTIYVAHTAKLSSTRPGTRVLRSNGTGAFADVTSSAMPQPTLTEGYEGNAVLVGRMNSADQYPDIYLSRPGTGVPHDANGDGTPDFNEARFLSNQKYADPWGMLLFDTGGTYTPQVLTGPGGLLAISGFVVCNSTWACGGSTRGTSVCKLFDYDFRSVSAAQGDLDGDFDADIVLVNDSSLADFTGTSIGTWVSCYGYGYVDYQYYTATAFGHATRILTLGSNGGLTDRTQTFMETAATADEDFRAVGAFAADCTQDFLNDVLIVHDQGITRAGAPASAARLLFQKSTGGTVTFRQNLQFFPVPPANGSGDDWRGDAIAAADLNADFYRDVVVVRNAGPVGSGTFAARVLVQDSGTSRAADRTSSVMTGVLPSGDDGRAKAVVLRDIDKDGDPDMVISTPDAVGTGNRRTRLLLNMGPAAGTGYPTFLDASSLLPAESSDPGNAVALSVGDVDGDGDLDLVLTDTHQTSGTPVRRTRIFRQDR